MIELRNVTKAYPTRRGVNVVLNNISVQFPELANVGVVGRNGAGKSTLLRILSGAEKPDGGTVRHNSRVSWPIGFAGGFSASLTGKENSRFVARIYGADIHTVSQFAYEFSELGEYFDMPVRTYSSGMRARLAFALSMAIDFDVYLVDEVTAVGDSSFQRKCRQAFADRRNRSSVIIVSHDMRTIRSYCQSCLVLTHGSVRQFDSIDAAGQFYEACNNVQFSVERGAQHA